jgi:uridine kinase
MAIAGDSGVGKDTFTQAITSSFGPKFSNLICGDDYHRFERQDQAWLNTTHLNPRMNNLLIWKNHLRNALNRIPFNYQSYDHNTGKFQQGNASDSSDLVVSQGLHALYPELCKKMDLSIYLKMENELRVDLKIRRDSTSRTQSSDEVKAKIKEREFDFKQYIATQESNADYVIHQGRTESALRLPNKLDVSSQRHLDIIRLLIQKFAEVCGEDAIEFESLYSGSFSANTTNFTNTHVKIILKREPADFGQMFPNEPEFANGNEGLFQTLTFLHFDSIRRESHFLNYEA